MLTGAYRPVTASRSEPLNDFQTGSLQKPATTKYGSDINTPSPSEWA